jgi:hypothetical protein
MMRQWQRSKSRPPATVRQCTGCVRASVRGVPPSVQKTGMRFPWHFFVHNSGMTRINTSPYGVYTPRTLTHPCTHLCVQAVYKRVYVVFHSDIRRKGACLWHPAP